MWGVEEGRQLEGQIAVVVLRLGGSILAAGTVGHATVDACSRCYKAAAIPTYPRSAPTYVAGRVALLVNAFASGNLDDLPIATEDA
jgi:hypothetical protein